MFSLYDLLPHMRGTCTRGELFSSAPPLPILLPELFDNSQHYQVYESPHVDQILLNREGYAFCDGDDPPDAFTIYMYPHGILQWRTENRSPTFQSAHPAVFWAQPQHDFQRLLWTRMLL